MVLKKANITLKYVSVCILIVFVVSILLADLMRVKSSDASALGLPAPTELLSASETYSRPLLRGIKLDKNNPLKIEFILDTANSKSKSARIVKKESQKLISYFLTALTVSKENLWVNLSPYEHDRIVPDCLAKTSMGKDMLAQDYILKQLASSLTHPETDTGKNYWSKLNVGAQHAAPKDTFNKIWIVPGDTTVFENEQTAFITEAKLDLMTEQDYFAEQVNGGAGYGRAEARLSPTKKLLPVLNREVNEGKHFAELRQIYYSLILGTWFKQKFMNSLFKHYIDQEKLSCIDINDPKAKEKIWKLYCRSFEKGVYNLTKSTGKGSQRRSFASGGCAMQQVGFSRVPMNNLDDNAIANSAIGELNLISSSLFAYDGEKRIASSSVSSEERIERVLESSRGLIRTDDVLALDAYLFKKAKDDGSNYVYVSLRSQQQLDALSKLIKVNDGDYELLDGPVYNVIINGGVLLLDYDNSHPALIEGFNSLFDENPFYKDIENVSPDLKVVAAMKEEKKSATDSNGFLDLDTTARSRFILSEKISQDYTSSLNSIKQLDTDTAQETIDIYLDSAPDFDSVLLGSADFATDGTIIFNEGKLLNAIIENVERLENNEEPLPIVIKGDCWENTEFLKFMQQLMQKREFYVNGDLKQIPQEIEFLKADYDYADNINDKQFVVLGSLDNSDEAYLINKKTQDILFGRRYITTDNKNAQLPGLLENKELKIQVVEKLDKWVWDRLMHSDCKVQIELAPGVVVPKVYRDFISKKIRNQKISHTAAKDFEKINKEQTFLLGSDDATYSRYKLIEQYGAESTVFYPITPFTDKTQLFETIKVARKDNKYDCELIKQQLLDDLSEGKTIVLENIDLNNELYDDLITLFAQKPYLILNGERHNLDTFSGKVVATISKREDASNVLNYAELDINKHEINKTVLRYFPSLKQQDLNEVIELVEFFKENIIHPKQQGLYPQEFSSDFSRIMLYCQHLDKSNDKLKAFEDVFMSSYYWDKELRFYMRAMARIKFGVPEAEQTENVINGKKLFELVDTVLDGNGLEKNYWQLLDSLSLEQLKSIHNFGASLIERKQKALEETVGPALLKYAANNGDEYDQIMYSKYFGISESVADAADIDMSLSSFHEFDEDRMAHVRKVLDMFGAVFLKGSPGTGKSYIASEIAKEMGFGPENVVGPITTGSDAKEADVVGSIIKSNEADFEFSEEAIAKWIPDMDYDEAQQRDARLLIVDEANLANEQLWNLLNGFFSKDASQRYIWVNGKKRYFNSNDRVIFTGNQETLEGRVYSDLIQKYMVTINFEDYDRNFYKKRLDEYLSNSKADRDELMDTVLDIHNVFADLDKSKVFSLRDIQEFARRLNKFTGNKWNTEDVLYQAWKQYYPQYEANEAKALAEIFKQKYGVDLEKKYSEELEAYIENNFYYFKQKGIVLTRSSAELALAAENFLDVVDEVSLSQIQGKRAVFFQGASGRGKDLLLEAVLEKQYLNKERNVIRINVSGDVEEFTQAVRQAQKTGSVLLAKEMNHLPSAFIEGKLNDVLTGLAHPGFALFATMNTSDFGACEKFSTAMYNRSLFHRIEDYPQEELKTIYSVLHPDILEKDIDYLINTHCWIRENVERLNKKPTTRDIRNALRLVSEDKFSIEDVINKVYGDYYLNGLLKNTEQPEKSVMLKFKETTKFDLEDIKKRVALFTKADFEDNSKKIKGYKDLYRGKFEDLLRRILDKRAVVNFLKQYPASGFQTTSDYEKELFEALKNKDFEYLDDMIATETFAILLGMRASGDISMEQLNAYQNTLSQTYGIDLATIVDKYSSLIVNKVFADQNSLNALDKHKSRIVAIEAIKELENEFNEIKKYDYDEKAKIASEHMKEQFERKSIEDDSINEHSPFDGEPLFNNLLDFQGTGKRNIFDRLASVFGGLNPDGNGNVSGISNPFLFSSDVNIADDTKSSGFEKHQNKRVYSRSSVSNYLLIHQIRKFDPINGKYFEAENNYIPYEYPLDYETQGHVVQYIVQSDTETKLLLPPDHIITTLMTEYNSSKLDVFYDELNDNWLLKNQGLTGKITMGVAKKRDKSSLPPLEIYDAKSDETLTREEALEKIKNSIPAYIWDYLQEHINSSYSDKTAAKNKILSSFYYTKNTFLNNKAKQEGNFLKYAFKYMSLLCDGFAQLDATLSYVLDMPIVIHHGKSSPWGEFASDNGHAWTKDEQGLRDPTVFAYDSSIFTDHSGITEDMLMEEMALIENSAKAKRKQLRDKFTNKEDNNELLVAMQEVKEDLVEEEVEEDVEPVEIDADLSGLTSELNLEIDELLEDLYKNSFVIDPESQKWDVTGKMDIMRFLQDPVRCCYRSSNSESISAREVVLLGELSDKGWNPLLEEVVLYMLNKGFTFRVDANKVIGQNSTDKLKDLARIKEALTKREQNDEEIVNDFFNNNKGSDDHLFIATADLQKRFDHLYLQKAIQTEDAELEVSIESEKETDIEEMSDEEKQKEINKQLYESEKDKISLLLSRLVVENFITLEEKEKVIEFQEDGSVQLDFRLCDLRDVSLLNIFKDIKSISTISFIGQQSMTNLDKLNLPNIKRLLMNSCDLDDVSFLNNFSNLEYVLLNNNKTMKNLDKLKLPRLKKLDLYNCDLEDVLFLNNLPSIEELYIPGNKSLKNLNDLDLPNLKDIVLYSCDLGDVTFLNNFETLESIELSKNKSLTKLDELKLPNLKKIYLSDCDLGDIRFLNNFTNLEYLGISDNTKLDGLNDLNLPYLTGISIRDCKLLYFDFLNNFRKIQTIDFGDLKDLKQLGILDLPDITKLSISTCEVADMRYIAKFKKLEKLYFISPWKISNFSALFELNYLVELDRGHWDKNGVDLESLDKKVEQNKKRIENEKDDDDKEESFADISRRERGVVREVLDELVESGQITQEKRDGALKLVSDGTIELDFFDSGITDFSFLEKINGFKSITKLNLSNNQIPNGLDDLNLPNLKELNMGNCGLTKVDFLDNFPKLENLSLTANVSVSASKLSKLKLSNVKSLSLAMCNLVKLDFLAGYPNLVELNLSSIDTLSVMIDDLSLPNLQSLNVGSCDFTTTDFVKQFPSLISLTLLNNSFLSNVDPLFEHEKLEDCITIGTRIDKATRDLLDEKLELNKINNQKTKDSNQKEETPEELFEREKDEFFKIIAPFLAGYNVASDSFFGVIEIAENKFNLNFRALGLKDLDIFHKLKEFKSINRIDLRDNSEITRFDIPEMPFVKELIINDQIPKRVHFISKFRNLEYLNLTGDGIVEDISWLSLPKLKEFTMTGYGERGQLQNATFLNGFTMLEKLTLGSSYALANMREIKLPNLKDVTLRYGGLVKGKLDISFLKNSPKLESWELFSSPVDETLRQEIQQMINKNNGIEEDNKEETPDQLFEREKKEIYELVKGLIATELPSRNIESFIKIDGDKIKLNFNDCNIETLLFLDDFKDFKSINSIDIRNNPDMLAFTVDEFPYVKEFSMSVNKFKNPDFVNKFSNLETLVLVGENVMDRMNEFDLPKLRKLHMQYSSDKKAKKVDARFLNNFNTLEHLELAGEHPLKNMHLVELPNLKTADFNYSSKPLDILFLKKSPKLRSYELNDSLAFPGQEDEIDNFVEANQKRLEGKKETPKELFERETGEINKYLDELRDNGTITADQRDRALRKFPNSEEYRLYMNEWNIDDVSVLNKFAKFKTIVHIDLSDNKRIKNWDKLVDMPNVYWLIMNRCNLKDISFLNRFKNVEILRLNENEKMKGWENVSLPLLNELNLQDCALGDVTFLNKFSRISDLDLNRNGSLKPSELDLPKLEKLHVGSCNLKELKFLDRHKKIKKLSLNYNKVAKLLNDLDLPELEELSFWGCKIKDLNFVSKFKKISKLILTDNKNIKNIDDLKEIDTLTDVQGLPTTSVPIKNQQELQRFLDKNKERIKNEEKNKDKEETPEELLARETLEINELLDELVENGDLSAGDRERALLTHDNDITKLVEPGKLGLKFGFFRGDIYSILNKFKDFKSIEILDLALNSLGSLQFKNDFPYVKKLVLGENELKNVNSIEHFTNLQSISLYNNKDLENIDALLDLKSLIVYDINGTKVSKADQMRLAILKRDNLKRIEEENSPLKSDDIITSDEEIDDLSMLEKKVIDSIIDIDLAISKIKDIFIENGEEEKFDAWLKSFEKNKEELKQPVKKNKIGFNLSADELANLGEAFGGTSGTRVSEDATGFYGKWSSSALTDTKGGIDFNNLKISGNSAASSTVIDIPFDLKNFKGFVFEISSIESLKDPKAYLTETNTIS